MERDATEFIEHNAMMYTVSSILNINTRAIKDVTDTAMFCINAFHKLYYQAYQQGIRVLNQVGKFSKNNKNIEVDNIKATDESVEFGISYYDPFANMELV